MSALRAGLAPTDVADVLRVDRAGVVKHVRSAMRSRGLPGPAPDADDAALLAALGQGGGASPPPSTACPGDLEIWTLANAGLDGPLLLAAAEHAADCAACMDRLVRARGAEAPPPPKRPGSSVPLLALALLAVVAAVWLLLL